MLERTKSAKICCSITGIFGFIVCVKIRMCLFAPAAPPSITEEQPSQEKEVDSNCKDEVLLNVIRPDYERPAPPPPMEPLYQLRDDGKVQGKLTVFLIIKYNRIKNRHHVYLL